MQDGFVVRIYATSTDPALQQELQLKLARKCLHACGISLFDLEKDLHIISKYICSFVFVRHLTEFIICFNVFVIAFSGTGFDEEAALLGAGREFALMKTASGKVGVCTIMFFGYG